MLRRLLPLGGLPFALRAPACRFLPSFPPLPPRRTLATSRRVFVCAECGEDAPKWAGRCPSCGAWDSLKEFKVEAGGGRPAAPAPSPPLAAGNTPLALPDVTANFTYERIPLEGSPELNRVLGGGLTRGSIVLLGGPPGVGKSTLLLSTADMLCNVQADAPNVLYVSGEESMAQVKQRAQRLGIASPNLFLLHETSLDNVFGQLGSLPGIGAVIVDSVQTMESSAASGGPGSPSQIRACAAELMQFAKRSGIPTVVTGHITKTGDIAGPRLLEHLVDTVLYMEDAGHSHRVVRSVKNRFGACPEVGVFSMTPDDGLRDVANPSEVFLQHTGGDGVDSLPGSAVGVIMEGSRPVCVEVQALVSKSYGDHRRHRATGFSVDRVNLLMSVMGMLPAMSGLRAHEVLVNVVGGLKVSDPGADLAVAMAIASSFWGKPVPRPMAFVAEVGLTGELRRVPNSAARVAAATKLGFKDCFVAATPDGTPPGVCKATLQEVVGGVWQP